MPGQFNTDPDLDGVHASTYGNGASGVAGINHSKTAPQAGVPGGNGVFGYTVNPFAAGVFGTAAGGGAGVDRFSSDGDGTRGDTKSNAKNGVVGTNSSDGPAPGDVPGGNGVYGFSENPNASGVFGFCDSGNGVLGYSPHGIGVRGGGLTAGQFDGDVVITGKLVVEGDICLPGAGDVAEVFRAGSADIEPGTVVVSGDDEAMHACTQGYDQRVAGVVSGARSLRPGIILAGRPEGGQCTLALVGRTYCKVDAALAPIVVGDLLTSSPTPGHAMKASDRARAMGAIVGKALGVQADGQGIIPILVMLG